MTQELSEIKWKLVTDSGEREITQEQMNQLIRAESGGARFVFFDDFMVNLAFIKEAYKISPTRPAAYWDDILRRPVKNG
jgi:hypothetical protein